MSQAVDLSVQQTKCLGTLRGREGRACMGGRSVLGGQVLHAAARDVDQEQAVTDLRQQGNQGAANAAGGAGDCNCAGHVAPRHLAYLRKSGLRFSISALTPSRLSSVS